MNSNTRKLHDLCGSGSGSGKGGGGVSLGHDKASYLLPFDHWQPHAGKA